MLALLPAIAFVSVLNILKKQGWEWRLAVLASAVACGTCVREIRPARVWNVDARGIRVGVAGDCRSGSRVDHGCEAKSCGKFE
jgi:hypothetical protein